MKVRPILFLALALLSVSLLTSCAPHTSSWPGLAADDESVYLSVGSQVFAVRLSDGKEVWHFPEKASGKLVFYAEPVLTEDGQLLVGSAGTEHTFFYLDARTGKQVNTFTEARAPWQGAPLVVGDKVYAPNSDGMLYMLDMQGGKLDAFDAGAALWSQPVSDGEHIYIGGLNHKLYALDAETLNVVWETDLGGALPNSPGLVDGMLYVGSFASKVTALQADSGKILWEAPTEGVVWGSPLVVGGNVYVGDLTGRLYGFDAATGSQIWDPPQPDGPITGKPLLFNSDLIVTTETGAVVLVGQDGKFKNLNTFEQTKFYTPAVAAGDLILVAPMGAKFQLAALDAGGKQVWAFPPEE